MCTGGRLAGIWMALLGLPALAQGTLGVVPDRDWRVCLPDVSMPPFLNRDAAHPGLAERLLVEAGRESGLSVRVLHLPSKRCRLMIDSGEADAVVAVPTAANREVFAFPMRQGDIDVQRRLATVVTVLLKRAGSSIAWDGHRFSGVPTGQAPSVAILLGSAALKSELVALGLRVDDTSFRVAQLLDRLSLGRVDLVACIREQLPVELAPAAKAETVVLPTPLGTMDYYVVVKPGLPEGLRVKVEAWWTAIGKRRDAVLPH